MTGDLDSGSGLAIMRLLADLNEEAMTIVFVTHDPRMAEFARRLIHVHDGRPLNRAGAGGWHAEDELRVGPLDKGHEMGYHTR